MAAVLLSWFPGQEGGAALADVLLGAEEPGGRLPTTWPVALADAPVTNTAPSDGELHYTEGVFIGYRAWERAGTAPAYPFGHGTRLHRLGVRGIEVTADEVTVRLRNTGARPGRETVQIYLAPAAVGGRRRDVRSAGWPDSAPSRRGPARASRSDRAARRAFEIWDENGGAWSFVPGTYEVEAAHSVADGRLTRPRRLAA